MGTQRFNFFRKSYKFLVAGFIIGFFALSVVSGVFASEGGGEGGGGGGGGSGGNGGERDSTFSSGKKKVKRKKSNVNRGSKTRTKKRRKVKLKKRKKKKRLVRTKRKKLKRTRKVKKARVKTRRTTKKAKARRTAKRAPTKAKAPAKARRTAKKAPAKGCCGNAPMTRKGPAPVVAPGGPAPVGGQGAESGVSSIVRSAPPPKVFVRTFRLPPNIQAGTQPGTKKRPQVFVRVFRLPPNLQESDQTIRVPNQAIPFNQGLGKEVPAKQRAAMEELARLGSGVVSLVNNIGGPLGDGVPVALENLRLGIATRGSSASRALIKITQEYGRTSGTLRIGRLIRGAQASEGVGKFVGGVGTAISALNIVASTYHVVIAKDADAYAEASDNQMRTIAGVFGAISAPLVVVAVSSPAAVAAAPATGGMSLVALPVLGFVYAFIGADHSRAAYDAFLSADVRAMARTFWANGTGSYSK